MGMNLECMLYLQKKGYLTQKKNKLLDIGPQNIYYGTAQQMKDFCQNQGSTLSGDDFEKEIKRIEYFSTPRPGETTSSLSELTDLTNIEYNSFDVCAALKTEILDLNFDSLPKHNAEYYDVILNFGTTEHVFNQWNSFKIIHEAAKVGGVVYHQLPGTGYLDHGYFCYTPVFFNDLARANGYEILDLFLTPAGLNKLNDLGLDIRDAAHPLNKGSAKQSEQNISCYNINVVLKKTVSAPFRCALELATSHSAVDSEIADRYLSNGTGSTNAAIVTGDHDQIIKKLIREKNQAISQLQQMRSSKSWKVTKPLRSLMTLVRR